MCGNTGGVIFISSEGNSYGDYYRLFTIGLVIFSIYLVVKNFLDGPEINAPGAANEDGVRTGVNGDHRVLVNQVLELHRAVDDHVINDQQQQTINAAAAAADDDDVIATADDRRRRRRILDVLYFQLRPETDYFADDDDDGDEDEASAARLDRRPVENRGSAERGTRSRKPYRFSRKQAARETTTVGEEKATDDRFFEDTEDGFDAGGCSRFVASEMQDDDEFYGRGIPGTDVAASSREPRTAPVTCSAAEEPIDETCAVFHSPAEDIDVCGVQTADDDDDSTSVARSNSHHGNTLTASVDDDRCRNKGPSCVGGSGKFGGKRTETSSPSTHPIIDHLNAKLLDQLTADIVQRLESQKVSEQRLREELEAMVKARRDSEKCYSDVVEQMKRFGLAWEGVRPREATRGQEGKRDPATAEEQ